MAAIYIGSARHDENNKYSGGKAGDQIQVSEKSDFAGEVSMQLFYNHAKGWNVLRPRLEDDAKAIANAMKTVCNNKNIGYSQSDRLGIIKNGINTSVATNCDCSSAVRMCVLSATGVDAGNFTTANEVVALMKTGLFYDPFKFVSQTTTPVCQGDILVTCTKGHTAIVVSETEKITPTYYPRYTGSSESLVVALQVVGEKDVSMNNRKKIAAANGIKNYCGSASQNTNMVDMLKNGVLKKHE